MTEQKHIIWSSDPDYEDWRGDLEEQYPELSEQERMELMVEQNNDYLDDERCNLNIQLSRPILQTSADGMGGIPVMPRSKAAISAIACIPRWTIPHGM